MVAKSKRTLSADKGSARTDDTSPKKRLKTENKKSDKILKEAPPNSIESPDQIENDEMEDEEEIGTQNRSANLESCGIC